MAAATRKLVTIITESILEPRLVRDLESLGARGYTITEARGKGSRGVRSAGWDASSNIRVEVICSAATAEAIAAYLREHYYQDFAMILFTGNVEVMRGEKF